MWVLKLEITNNSSILNELSHKFNLTMYGYPLSTYRKGKRFFVIGGGNIVGDPDDVKSFIKLLKKEKQFENIEYNDGFFLTTLEQPRHILPLYSSELINLEPVVIRPDFTQTYVLASWNKKLLDRLVTLKLPHKGSKINVKKFRQEKINGVAITRPDIDLTDKQKNAFDLAYKNGYYDVPRSSDLITLSKKMKLSLATFQVHLRKAEKKIMDFFTAFR